MCGLLGFMGFPPVAKEGMVKDLLILNTLRGVDGAGVAFIRTEGFEILKGKDNALNFMAREDFKLRHVPLFLLAYLRQRWRLRKTLRHYDGSLRSNLAERGAGTSDSHAEIV